MVELALLARLTNLIVFGQLEYCTFFRLNILRPFVANIYLIDHLTVSETFENLTYKIGNFCFHFEIKKVDSSRHLSEHHTYNLQEF